MTTIKITDFGARHFDKSFGGTKILDYTIEQFEKEINDEYNEYINGVEKSELIILDGYAPFCKLLVIKNFTKARVGSLPITLENYQYLRSGYSARRDTELPIFSRWFELPIGKPKAKYLVLVLYSKEQIDKEAKSNLENNIDFDTVEFEEFDAEWGIVAILGQSHPNEEPMKPETMLRNALGIKEGGSGVPLDRDKYMASVKFWDKHATVK